MGNCGNLNTDQFANLLSNFATLTTPASGTGGCITLAADSSVTAADVGKIMVNKNGLAKVAQRDSPNAGQLGQWQLTVNSVFVAPDPTVVQLKFTGAIRHDDFIRIGWVTFTFASAGSTSNGGNDILITPGDIPLQIQNVTDALAGGGKYAHDWTATNDGVDTVTIVMNPAYSIFTTSQLPNEGVLIPPVSTSGDNFDAQISNVIISVTDPGNIGDFENINAYIISGINLSLSFYEAFQGSNFPGQSTLFGMVFPTNVNDFASAIATGINLNYVNEISATVSANVVTISQLQMQTVPIDFNFSAPYYYYVPSLSSEAETYCSFSTISDSTVPNFAFVNDPVLGTLVSLQNGLAYISATHLQRVKLSGNNSVSITGLANNLNFDFFVNRLCIINNDGTVEGLGSVDYAKNNFGWNPDAKTGIEFLSQGCIYWALSAGNVGDTILVTSNIPPSLYLAAAFGLLEGGAFS